MLVSIVLLLFAGAVMSRISGPTFVTHEWSRSDQQQPTSPAAVAVSPSLCSFVTDRHLMFAADRVYRPPGTVTSVFTEQLSDLFDQLVLLDSQFVVLGDFNTPGVTAGQLDQRAIDVFTQHGSIRQHSNARQSHERQHSGPRIVTRRPAQRSARLGRDCTFGQLIRPSSRHVPSGRPANAASHDHIQLPAAAPG